MKTAPVVIPTLNRYEHLRNCIESLAANKYAADTDLYISVDYPPASKYEEGYKKVLEYVGGTIEGFRNVYVFIQKENLGPSENGRFLYDKVWENTDRLIYTEDDNIFSPNYLEYMNGMLDKYEDDREIFAINGYLWPVELTKKDGVFKTGFFSAWGCGLWKDRLEEFAKFRREDIANYLKDKNNRRAMKEWSYHVYKNALYIASDKYYLPVYRTNSEEKELRDSDFIIAVYLFITGKKTIIPYLSKVRNMGHDGTGENCNTIGGDAFDYQLIDDRDSYEISDAEILDKKDADILKKFFDDKDSASLKEHIKMMLMTLKL